MSGGSSTPVAAAATLRGSPTEHKIFMAEKKIVEYIKRGRAYPADSDVTY